MENENVARRFCFCISRKGMDSRVFITLNGVSLQIQCPACNIYLIVVSWASMMGTTSLEEDADSSRASGITSGFAGSTVVLCRLCCNRYESVLSYSIFLHVYTHQLFDCNEASIVKEKLTMLNETDTGHVTPYLVLRRRI